MVLGLSMTTDWFEILLVAVFDIHLVARRAVVGRVASNHEEKLPRSVAGSQHGLDARDRTNILLKQSRANIVYPVLHTTSSLCYADPSGHPPPHS